ncbi:MAG TPA: SRPBCC family protein [Candidatus Limnocylindrales bacterium]
MATFRLATHVAAPLEQVFALWTNLDRMREWIGGVTGVTDVSGPFDQAGTTYTTWFGKMSSRTTVVQAERPHLFHTRYRNRILSGESLATFEADGHGGTRLTEEFRTEGLVAWVFARIFATGSYKGSFRGELNEFVRIAEREAVAPGVPASGT